MCILLKNDVIRAKFDSRRGAFVSLKGLAQEEEHEFLLTPEEFPQFDGDDGRWLGSLLVQTEKDGSVFSWNTSDFGEYRMVNGNASFVEAAYPEGVLGGLSIRESFELEQGAGGLVWSFTLQNDSGEPIRVRRLGMPLMMDQYFRKDSSFKYEKNVMRHACISHHSSVIYWAHSNGKMPMLFMQTLGTTALDMFEREETGKFGSNSTIGEAFEGCFTAYLWHEETECSHIQTAELTLGPGESRTFAVCFSVCSSFAAMVDELERRDNLAAKVLPGMVAPVGDEVIMTVRCGYPVTVKSMGGVSGDTENRMDGVPEETENRTGGLSGEAENGAEADLVRALPTIDGKNQRFAVILKGYGVREFHLCYQAADGARRVVKIQMFGTETPEKIIQKHASFIAEKQFETDETDPCFHGLLMWDMIHARRVNSTHNPYGADWMRGGSDEIGLVSGLFLSEKNVYQPDISQIQVLDQYVRDFIEKRLTEQPGYRVHRMVPWFTMFDDFCGLGADDIWRAFNYVHVINTYYNMYRLSRLYQIEFLEEPGYYILQAYRYLQAMFSCWMFPDGVGASQYGNMGEMTIALKLADALREEGFCEEAADTDRIVQEKSEFFSQKPYPFGSEMAYDTTAYEAVYAYGKAANDQAVMASAVQAALGNRGHQPVWYLYQTDVRQMGDSNWNDSYMTQLAAWTFYDWVFEQGHVSQELLEAWAAAYYAGWALFNSGGYWDGREENSGASAWITVGERGHFSGIVQNVPWQKDPYRYGCIACSGESSLGYFAALKIAASVVFDHSAAGRIGLGCALYEEKCGTVILPRDGVGRRMYHIPDGWGLRLNRDRMKRVQVRIDGGMEITLENLTGDVHELKLSVRREGSGWMEYTVVMKQAGEMTVELPPWGNAIAV